MNRRIGKILIHNSILLDHPDVYHKITKGMFIVRAEQLFEHNAIEYVALSDKFDEVAEGDRAPCYIPNMEGDEVVFERKDG